MDPFTTRILESARERQRKLLQIGGSDGTLNVLKDTNNVKSQSAPEVSSGVKSTTVFDNPAEKTSMDKETCGLHETASEGNLTKFIHISSDMPGSPQPHLKTFNIHKENFNMEIRLSSTDDVRVEVQFEDEADNKENEVSEPVMRDVSKSRLDRLGKLYAGGDDVNISSPIHRTEATFSVEKDTISSPIHRTEATFSVEKDTELKTAPTKVGKGLCGLAALAKNINEWDNDPVPAKVHREVESVRKPIKPPAPRPPISKVVESPRHVKPKAPQPPTPIKTEETPKLDFDEKLLNTLESQGYTRTTSNSRLVYNYELPQPKEDCISEDPELKPLVSPTKSIASRAAMFENFSPSRNTKDPALLSVAERKALFEKNKGSALLPKAPITLAPPSDNNKSPTKPLSPRKTDKNTASVLVVKSPPKYPAPRPPIRPQDDAYRVAPGQRGGIASKVAALFQSKSTISQQQIENDIKEQRQKELDVLLNRFHKPHSQALNLPQEGSDSEDEDMTDTTVMLSHRSVGVIKKIDTPLSPPKPPPLPPATSSGLKRLSQGGQGTEDSPKVTAVLEDVKRIKVSPLKPGKLYPCLSDIEATTETETEINTASVTPNSSYEDNNYSGSDSEMGDTSFSRQVIETVCKNQTPLKESVFHDSSESDFSDILDEKDDYLDEAATYNDSDNLGPSPPKQGRCVPPVETSSSFHYKDCSPYKRKSPEKDNEAANKLPTHVVDGENILPLTHTVSFYRKQQKEANKATPRKIIRSVIIEESCETNIKIDEDLEVQPKIQELLEEIKKQQTIISQTSQALNLCYSTPEFTGSTEQVEAERVLLLATHRRSAAQREVERLQVLRTLTPTDQNTGVPLEKGSLVISNIVLPLKREYVRALNATGGKGHHVVCLVKCADQVLHTKLISTVATNDRNPDLELKIPGVLHLENVYSNFTVQLEVYCLQAQEEVLPHEVKYHINNKKNIKLTPRKGKTDSRLFRPIKESPAGPHVVRSPTFALMGYVVFSIQGINRKNWSLNNTPSMSPLEGIVEMCIKCELCLSVEHRGFLTMLEDVSGYGNWHRRWCLLKGHTLTYWKYPEDERRKAPIGNIDLKQCITQQIGPVRRDICARQHTVLIEITRPALSNDKDSLFMECKGNITILRHLISSDTKEECIQWCVMFNKVLMGINMYGSKK